MSTYFVSLTGNDNNSGTQGSPFGTITKGFQVMVSGDTLYLRSGIYTQDINSQSQSIPSGTSWSNPVTVSNFSSEIVILNGLLNINGYGSQSYQYLLFNGLILDGQNNIDTGVFFSGPLADHLRLQNSEVRNFFHQGIQGYDTHDIDLINVKSHHNGTDRLKHGLYMANQYILIDGCEFYSNSGYGIQIYHSGGTNQDANHGIIRNTRIHDNLGDGGVTINATSDFLFYNNLIYNNIGDGVDTCYQGVNNVRILNNTFYGNGGIAVNICAGVPGVIIQNNIIYNNGSAINDASGVAFQSNNLINQNPFFVNTTTADFHLTSASISAINMGTILSEVLTDFDGITRPQGSSYDIGAYEFGIAPPPPPPTTITCDDSLPWTLISSGVFANNTLLKTVNFNIKPARWICFRGISEINGNPWTSCAEFTGLVNGVSLLQTKGILLAWDHALITDPVTDTTVKFRIYRSIDPSGVFVLIGEVPYPTVSYLDTSIMPSISYSYEVSAVDYFGNESFMSNIVSTIASGILSHSVWCFDSEELVGEGSNNGHAIHCIDGLSTTFWHTRWTSNVPGYPHNIVIDLGTVYPLNGFSYLPRQDGFTQGTVAAYEFYVADYWVMSGRMMKLPMMQPMLAM